MKILVTGGAGFIGSHLVDALIKRKYKVVILDNLSTGQKRNLNPKAKFYKIDIISPRINQIFRQEKPVTVFHLAAQINLRHSLEKPLFDAQTNILGGLNILETSRQNQVKKFIFISTGGALYNEAKKIPSLESQPVCPASPYALAKFTLEKYLTLYHQLYGLKYLILRLANIYGPRQNTKAEAGVVAIFIEKILRGEQPIINGHGRQTRDYLYVDDVINGCLLSLKTSKTGVYNLGTGQETSVNEIFQRITNALNQKIQPKYGPAIKGELSRSALAWQKIKKELGWQPKINLNDGLKMTIEWFKKNTIKI